MKVIYEYVWLDVNSNFRSKNRVCDVLIDDQNNLPSEWNYDGSSTGQAIGKESEIIIKPVVMYRNPFYKTKAFLVMCQTFKPDGTPLNNNHYFKAKKAFDTKLSEEPWYGIEQEYFIMNPHNNKPLGFDESKTQGQYYCSVGTSNTFGRKIADKHLEACIYAHLSISGTNAEVAPGQWEYQIGPCVGIESGNQVWVSRYILERIAEKNGYNICWDPKPLKGDWNGSGCHTNYSTKNMRDGNGMVNGLEYIYMAIDKLEDKHKEHMKVYGKGNEERMTGAHETASFDTFSYGCGNRGASIRIGNDVLKKKCGYFEDRRPASNMDPYLVTSKIFETTILNNIITDVTDVPEPYELN